MAIPCAGRNAETNVASVTYGLGDGSVRAAGPGRPEKGHVMAKSVLGEFEHQVLLSALRLGRDAYSASIVRELEAVTGRDVSPAAVYIALRRLEEAGLAASEFRAGAEGEEGGRERRYFRVLPLGLRMMRESRSRYLALWADHEELLEDAR